MICRTQVFELCFSAQRRTSFFPRLPCWSRSATCSRCWTATTSEVRFSTEERKQRQQPAVVYRVWDMLHVSLCQLCLWCPQTFQNTPPSFSACHRFTSDNRYLTFSICWLFNLFFITPLCLSYIGPNGSSVPGSQEAVWGVQQNGTNLWWKGWQPLLSLHV